MRLLAKTTLYFLTALVPLLIAAGFVLYSRFSSELNSRMDEELITEEVQWVQYLKTQAAIGNTFALRTPEIIITPIDAPVTKFPNIETVNGFSATNNKEIPFRQLTHVVEVDGIPYLITLRKSQEQRTMIVANVTKIMLLVFVLLFLITMAVNWIINLNVWRPFQRSLQKISSAELQKMEAIHFERSATKEFDDLNTALNQMVNKIYLDYVSIKEFTENAAHEMQTPVAIVQSKLELLLQDDQLNHEQTRLIVQASDALSRLSKLNRSLLLLSKIENNQYESSEAVSVISITQKYLELFKEQLQEKQIRVQTNFASDWMLSIHPVLADTLISNLLGNAIKYNYNGGSILCTINHNEFCISNSSYLPPIHPDEIFKRFTTKGAANNSTGLGLAIVKKICDVNHLNIIYTNNVGMHLFTITSKD